MIGLGVEGLGVGGWWLALGKTLKNWGKKVKIPLLAYFFFGFGFGGLVVICIYYPNTLGI